MLQIIEVFKQSTQQPLQLTNIEINKKLMSINSKPNSKYTTIFSDPQPESQPSPDHPLFYYQQRNNFLCSLSEKYQSKYRLPTMDLRRNVRVDYLMNKYQHKKTQVDRQQKINKCYLNTQQFTPIFADCVERRRDKNRQRNQQQKLRRDLNALLQHQQQQHEQPQHDNQSKPIQKYNTILIDYRTDPICQKQLYLLDLQLGKLNFQAKIQKKVKSSKQTCNNIQLVSKMSKNILSAYMVHFDQIYNTLIDEILVQQVYYLNYLEAQYKVQKSEWNSSKISEDKVRYQNAKTIQMMELIKGLEDLCDQ